MKENGNTYAQRRANETGRAYIVTAQEHVLLDVPANQRLAKRHCGGVARRFTRERTK